LEYLQHIQLGQLGRLRGVLLNNRRQIESRSSNTVRILVRILVASINLNFSSRETFRGLLVVFIVDGLGFVIR
jgi:hypothetical protein